MLKLIFWFWFDFDCWHERCNNQNRWVYGNSSAWITKMFIRCPHPRNM